MSQNFQNQFVSLFFFLGLCFGVVPISGFAQTDPLKDSIDRYYLAGRFKKALPFARTRLKNIETEKGPENLETTGAQNLLGDILTRTGELEEAEKLLIRALEIRKRTLGENQLQVADVCLNLGTVYKEMGNLEEAEKQVKEALRIRKLGLSEDHLEIANASSNLGTIYMEMGRYELGEEILLNALAIRKKILGENSKEVAASCNNLGILYWRSGQLPKAEEFHEKSLKIRERIFEDAHPDISRSLNNLGLVYIFMGNLPKAETFLVRSLEMKKKINPEENLDIAESYNNLGNLVKEMGRLAESSVYSQKALLIEEKFLGPNHPSVGGSYNNLGSLHYALGNYHLAEKYHKKALEIWSNANGPDYFEVAGSHLNLGNVYADQGKHQKASESYQRALEIRRKIFGEGHADLANPYHDEAMNLKDQGNLVKAEEYFTRSKDIYLAQIQQFFPSFSDEEKENFFATLSPNIDEFQAFTVLRYPGNHAISGQLYNHQLTTKALLMNSSAKWKHRIKSSGDKKLFLKYTEWEALQNQLAGLLQSVDSTERLAIDSIKTKSEKLEKELSLRSENFALLTDRHQPTWQEVQKRLKLGEAAVEIIRMRRYGISRTVTDTSDPARPTYRIKGLTDSAQYVALIVKPGAKMPEMVLLANGTELEGKHFQFYQNCLRRRMEDNQSYRQFWQRIGDKMGGIKRVYFSGDGVYLNLNLNILKNPKTRKYILDELDIRLVTVTKDLLPTSNRMEPLNKLACLVGFPNYYTEKEAKMANLGIERKTPNLRYGMRLDANEVLAELPETKVEVERIADMLVAKGWEVKSYLADEAIEENLKESYKPKLLHIATHGYFQPTGEVVSNPLLRSGLMLARAGTTLRSGPPETSEDGILTAYEAMNLNLDNTDLVVLSACETGLGEIRNGEGVYGLQRAFKVAGAKSIIMSLWKVSDAATQELMVRFYRNWLGETDKPVRSESSKRAAFLKAQKELKAKYPDPYYWGAFVMVGE